MEALVLKAVARELAPRCPARVQAVLQPSPREIVLALRAADGVHHLLVSTEPESARLHLVAGRPATLPAPTAFCRLLRKHLEGRVLVAVESPGMERVVRLALSRASGPRADLVLVAELMGRHSNLILLYGGTVVDALQHVPSTLSRVRTVVPGEPYRPPPAEGRADLAAIGRGELAAALREGGAGEAAGRVVGLSRGLLDLARAVALRRPGSPDPAEALADAVLDCVAAVARGECRPVVYPGRGQLLPFPAPGWEGEPQEAFATMNEAAASFYGERQRARERERAEAARRRELDRAGRKLAREIAMRAREIAEGEDAEFLQSAGTALLAAAGGVPRGSTVFHVEDAGEGRAVALDPALGPRQNAEVLFRRARKLRRREALARERLPLLRAELSRLESGSVPPSARPGGARAAPAPVRRTPSGTASGLLPGIREYRSPAGWRVLVGKSGRGNEYLTARVASPEDYWFHVRDYPGAHVVLKAPPGAAPPEAIRAAGEVAAWHSGARTQGQVEVAYARRKHVRRVRGGPPGKVILGESLTIRVRPQVPAALQEVKGG